MLNKIEPLAYMFLGVQVMDLIKLLSDIDKQQKKLIKDAKDDEGQYFSGPAWNNSRKREAYYINNFRYSISDYNVTLVGLSTSLAIIPMYIISKHEKLTKESYASIHNSVSQLEQRIKDVNNIKKTTKSKEEHIKLLKSIKILTDRTSKLNADILKILPDINTEIEEDLNV